jgi:acetylornithine/N-succinyldiaminopimelate aminotransferase
MTAATHNTKEDSPQNVRVSRRDGSGNTDALFGNYNRSGEALVRGEGVWAWDENGTKWLDFSSGIAVNALGHAHPHLVEALTEQAGAIWHTSNLFPIKQQERLAARLVEASFADKVFFCNSGAEAMEGCIKAARRHFYNKGEAERIDIITFEGAFHGRTLATIAAGGQEKYLEGFGPKAPGFVQVPFGDHEALRQAVGQTTAAILVEPIQGEGGVRPVPNQCLRGLRELCDEEGILLIFDEVQTGIGRTGFLFAHELAGAAPDLLASAKGLGGGFPVGAVLATEEVASALKPGTHGTTFGGNMLAMAVGNAVLDIVLGEGFLEQVRERAGRLRQRMAQIVDTYPDLVEGVPGEGLLSGFKCKAPAAELVAAMRGEHLMTVPAGNNVIRIMPPLIVSDEEIDEAIARIDRAFATYSAS